VDLLKSLLNTLPVSQRRSVTALLAEKRKKGTLFRERDVERALISTTQEDTRGPTFITLLASAASPISSVAWNDSQERLFLDLNTLYDEVTLLDSQARSIGTINRDEFVKSRAAILKVVEQIRVYQFLREFPEYQDVRFIDFRTSLNETGRRPPSVVSNTTRTLQLGARQQIRQQQANDALKTTKASITIVGGGQEGGMSKQFKPEDMLDANPDTFWGELLLADGPIVHVYKASHGLYQAQGPIAEVDLTMSQAERLNNIQMLPFGMFPLNIVDVAYKASPADDAWETIPGFSIPDPSLDYIEFDFAPIHVAVLRIVLEQESYTINTYHMPRKIVENSIFWEQALEATFDRSVHDIVLNEIQSGKVEADPQILAELNALSQVTQDLSKVQLEDRRNRQFELNNELLQAMGKTMSRTDPKRQTDVHEPVVGLPIEDPNELVEIRKYEYTFGFRTIELNSILYEPFGYYDSPQFSPGATVLAVELDVDESNVAYNDAHGTFYRSSVEYEVETGENKRFPILPTSYADYEVPDEYIEVDRRDRTGITRFAPGSASAIVRKNGIRLDFADYTFTLTGPDGRGTILISETAFDPNAVFTIRYVSNQAATILDLDADVDSTRLTSPEVHEGTDRNNSLRLNYYPYAEYSIVNSSSWTMDDPNDAKWRFVPSVTNINSDDGSRASVTNGSTAVDGDNAVTGATNDSDWSTLIGKVVSFRVKGDLKIYQATVSTATDLTLAEVYQGTTDVDANYEVGEGISVDGVFYGLDQISYEPLQVLVNDQKAFNLTNYETLEHQAFTPVQRTGRRFQFVQAGRILYFNAPVVDARIEVFYSWLTQYLKVNAVMRSNIPVLTEATPKLTNYKLKLKTTRL
jgi:hypothetical protein